jgi:DNA-binding GntR family transcriptional regulator
MPPDAARDLARRRLKDLTVMELRDLGDMYAVTSGGAADLAAARASEDDVRGLRGAVQDLTAAAPGGPWRRADARLRVLIAVAAQSPRLYHAEVELQAEVGLLLWLASDASVREDDLAATETIVAAIEARRRDRARDAAEERVRVATRRLIEDKLATEEP